MPLNLRNDTIRDLGNVALVLGWNQDALGAVSQSEPADQFWGDRMASVKDSFGNTWSIATHKEDPTPEEIAKRMAAMNR
jgi:hypothetical protein